MSSKALRTNQKNFFSIKITSVRYNSENKTENSINSSLVIEKKFIFFLNSYLSADKPLLQKQQDIGKLMNNIENVYQILFMYEKYNKDFCKQNFINFVMKLAKLSISNCNVILSPIKLSILKSLLKHGPNYNGQECKKLLFYFNDLGILLDEPICKALLLLLRFHLNDLELNDLIELKALIYSFNKHPNLNKRINYIDSFEKSLNLSVQLQYHKISDIYQALYILIYFGLTLSPVDYQKILTFISKSSENFQLSLTKLTNLVEILSHNYRFDILTRKVLEKIIYSIGKHKNMIDKCSNIYISDECSIDFKKRMHLYELFNRIMKAFEIFEFLPLKKFDYIIKYQLKYINDIDISRLQQNNLVINSSKILLRIFLIHRYKSYETIMLMFNKFFDSKYELINKDENFPLSELIYYIGFTMFDK